jgi:hypothetical protein
MPRDSGRQPYGREGTKHRSPAVEARESGTWSYECELSVRSELDSDNGSKQSVQCWHMWAGMQSPGRDKLDNVEEE